MKNIIFISVISISLFMLTSCQQSNYPNDTVTSSPNPITNNTDEPKSDAVYDSQSWETVISKSCKSFSDGCNSCSRSVKGEVECTMMACETYQKPKCLD